MYTCNVLYVAYVFFFIVRGITILPQFSAFVMAYFFSFSRLLFIHFFLLIIHVIMLLYGL